MRLEKWNPTAEEAFVKLKTAFTSELPFIVEVYASESKVGTVLSQKSGERPKMYLVAFFSHKFMPAECNYDIGNRELLTVKLPLENGDIG